MKRGKCSWMSPSKAWGYSWRGMHFRREDGGNSPVWGISYTEFNVYNKILVITAISIASTVVITVIHCHHFDFSINITLSHCVGRVMASRCCSHSLPVPWLTSDRLHVHPEEVIKHHGHFLSGFGIITSSGRPKVELGTHSTALVDCFWRKTGGRGLRANRTSLLMRDHLEKAKPRCLCVRMLPSNVTSSYRTRDAGFLLMPR